MAAREVSSEFGRAAAWYARERGWRVFPLHSVTAGVCSCGAEDCKAPGKHPRVARGCLEATTDAAQIAAWWKAWPTANVGIATGRGLVVLDVDDRHGGRDSLVDLRRVLGDLPETVCSVTGSGGLHYYLGVEVEVRNSANVLGPGLDVRGEGGYVVAPPSTHASGRIYGWEVSSRPDAVSVAPVPEAWLAAMTQRPKLRVLPGGQGEPIHEGDRNTVLFKRGSSMRAAGFDRSAIEAALLAENDTRCVPAMDPAEVRAIASSVCRYPPGHSAEVRAKVREAVPTEQEREPEAWMETLFRTPKGAVRSTFANLCAILRNAQEYASLRYNDMTLSPELRGVSLGDADLGAIREAIERAWGFSPGAEATSGAMLTVSSERRYHPVREYLEGLTWDGAARIDTVCERILRVEPTAINRTMVRAWFVSAAARAMYPGAKVDTALVLVGPQGVQKSGFFRVLGGEWFSDTAINLDSKDAYQQLRHAWIYEWGEIEQITGRAHAGKVKAFVASQVDAFRPPFARAVAVYKRSNVIVGSTNEDHFLNDPTGSRRFWVLRVHGRIDLAALAEERDQLWAEAMTALASGEPWWLDGGAEEARMETAEDFRVEDPWEGAVASWLASRMPGDEAPITTRRLLSDCLGVRLEDQKHTDAMRVAAAMKRLGWRNRVERVDANGLARVWRPA